MTKGNLSNWGPTGKSWFFGIGINQYPDFPDLTNAVRDVQAFKALLVNHYDVDAESAHILFDTDATKKNIIDTLDFLSANIADDDKLIIYYSGHGKLNQKIDVGYWIPHDGEKNSTAQYILNSTIKDYVGGIAAKHILLISDACFSGSIFMRGDFRSSDTSDGLSDRTSRWAICSGRHDEEVYDGDPGGHSPFASSLLSVLEDNTHDALPVGRIVHHVIEETAANYEQLPDGRPMFGVGHKGGQYVFRKKGTTPADTSSPKRSTSIDHPPTQSNVPQTTKRKNSILPQIAPIAILSLWTSIAIFLIVAVSVQKTNFPVVLEIETSRVQFTNLEKATIPFSTSFDYVGINNFSSIDLPIVAMDIIGDGPPTLQEVSSNQELIEVVPSPGNEVRMNFGNVFLDQLEVDANIQMIMEVDNTGEDMLTLLRIDGSPGNFQGELTLQDSLLMHCDYCIFQDLQGPNASSEFNFLDAVIYGPKDQVLPITFRGSENVVSLEIESEASDSLQIKLDKPLSIQSLQFLTPVMNESPSSSIIGGLIHLIDQKDKPYHSINIGSDHALILKDYDRLNLSSLVVYPQKIKMTFNGVVGNVLSGIDIDNVKDQNPTLWQWLLNNSRGSLFTILGMALLLSAVLYIIRKQNSQLS